MGIIKYFFGSSTKKTSILIYGHAGWIGTLFTDYLIFNHPKIDICNKHC